MVLMDINECYCFCCDQCRLKLSKSDNQPKETELSETDSQSKSPSKLQSKRKRKNMIQRKPGEKRPIGTDLQLDKAKTGVDIEAGTATDNGQSDFNSRVPQLVTVISGVCSGWAVIAMT